MSQLVFLAASGGSVTLTNADTGATYNLIVPAADGTLLYQDSSSTLTVTNLTVTGLLSITGTSAFKIPVGTTAQRPTSPTVGMIRYNTDGGGFYEGYLVNAWVKFSTTSLSSYSGTYLIAAGGAGGGAGGGGGNGTSSSISGSATFYCGGGGGAGSATGQPAGAGGTGGGGPGMSTEGGVPATAGTTNTGSGGGGSRDGPGGNGGSGIVIVSYAGAQRGTGGTYSSSGGQSIHTFLVSGSYIA